MHLGLAAGGQEEVEGALDLAGDGVADGVDHLRHLARHGVRAGDDARALEVLRLLEGDVELALDLLGDVVAAVGDVAGERAGAVGDDVDRRQAGPHVDDGEGLIRRDPPVHLEDVLHGEGVDVDDQRLELGAAGDLRVVADLVALGGDEEQIDLPRLGPAAQHLVVDVHVLDVEGDVLLRLPLDLLVELGRGHHRHRDLADDDGLPADAERHVLLLDLGLGEDLPQPLDDGLRVHHVAVDDRLRRQRLVAGADQPVALPALLDLADLDRARSDVDADEVLSLRHLSPPRRSWHRPEVPANIPLYARPGPAYRSPPRDGPPGAPRPIRRPRRRAVASPSPPGSARSRASLGAARAARSAPSPTPTRPRRDGARRRQGADPRPHRQALPGERRRHPRCQRPARRAAHPPGPVARHPREG